MIRIAPVLLLAGVASGQSNVGEGPFLGLPVHAIAGPATTGPLGVPLNPGELYLKRAGVGAHLVSSVPFAVPRPDFSFGAMFGAAAPTVQLASISSGFHTTFVEWQLPLPPAEPVPLQSVPANAWGAMFFSVTSTSAGEVGSVIAEQVALSAGAGAGADVFSVILPQGNVPAALLDCTDVGVPQLANDSSEMGLPTTGQPELGDFDPFFTFYESDGPLPAFLSPQPFVYFTLSPSSAMANPAWYGTPALANGASILRMQWNGSAWTTPVLFLSHVELGLPPTAVIDALAVDETSSNVLLSLAGAPPEQQLLVAFSGVLGGLNPPDHIARTFVYDPTAFGPTTSARVAKVLQADYDTDIDSICTVDPNAVNNLLYKFFPYVYGCRDTTVFPATMSASAWLNPGDVDTHIVVSVSGLQDAPGGGLIGFLLWGVPAVPWDPQAPSPVYLPFDIAYGWTYVLATSQVGQVEFDWPTAMLPPYLDFQWAMLDATGIYQSNVVGCKF